MAVMLDREISSGSLHRWVMEGLQGRAWEDSSAVLARQYQQSAFKPEARNGTPATLPAQLDHRRSCCF